MNKKLIAVAIAAAVAAPSAMAEAIFYGKIRQSIDMVDMSFVEGEANLDMIEIRDQASRIGFKGSEDLGNGMKAVWQMEFGVAISQNGCPDWGKLSFLSLEEDMFEGCTGDEFNAGNVVSARNAFVGLAGDFGTVLVGRHDTPLKISTGSLDPFADTAADYNNFYAGAGIFGLGMLDLRADGTLAYISPSMNGLTIAAAVVPGENNQADGLADAWSAAAMYSNGGLFLTAAMESGDSDIDYLGGDADYDQWRVGGSYTMDAFKVGAMYGNTELEEVGGPGSLEADHWSIFGTYTMGNNVFKVRYFDTETDFVISPSDYADFDSSGFAIGVDHNFSARTQLSLLYVNSDEDVTFTDGSISDGGVMFDGDILSVQLNHSF